MISYQFPHIIERVHAVGFRIAGTITAFYLRIKFPKGFIHLIFISGSNINMLNAFVCVFKRTLAGNNDFRIIILYLQEIAKFPFYSFRFGEFEGDLHIQPFAASRTDKIYFLRSQGSDFYVVTAEEQVVAVVQGNSRGDQREI